MCKHVGLGVQVSVSEDGIIQFSGRYLSTQGISLLETKRLSGVCTAMNVLGDFKGN